MLTIAYTNIAHRCGAGANNARPYKYATPLG